uniref:Desmoplakin b n=1 Tax=Sphaeramia orbicularis TaxID=375764 RepID=A0A672YXU5_9TELE
DPSTIDQQLVSHQKFHSSIQRSVEVDRARDELVAHFLLPRPRQQFSCARTQQLRDFMQIIQEISKEIMWVNDREEEELMFDWGDKNIDQYIPRKQESYSKLMSALEDKEKQLNKLKAKVDSQLKSNHPASDKIEAYRDTLQTQWSWLLQITKCIDVHLKENAAYSQFFREANETYSALQKRHEAVRKNFPCDKNTPLENLQELLKGLERERDKIMENKRQVQHLVSKSKSIVRLKPRNPDEKSSSPIIVKALCDFKQDQKVILKDNEGILKDNSQRSKWHVTGPGGLDMLVPSVCLMIPPPNPISISLANKNEQYYEAIMSIWNQLYINVKSLIAWQYCLLDIKRINSLTMTMLSKMSQEEYRQIIRSMETHYEEFKKTSKGSQMFAEEDRKVIENQFTGAQAHYDKLVVQLPSYGQCYVSAFTYTHLCKIALFSPSFFFFSIRALRDLLQSLARAEDTVKVYEARLTEKETTSLQPSEVQHYMTTLEAIKAELDQKRDVLAAMEAELTKATHWNCQVGGPFHRCDMMLSKYTEQVSLLSDRWKRIQGQIDTRYVLILIQDLEVYLPQLQHYQQVSTSLSDWIDITRKKQDALQATKIESVQALKTHISNQKVSSHPLKDYETDLASYSSGLETLLNIPIKRTMLKSPSVDLNQEATHLQTRYMELLTLSGDYNKFLGDLLKNMEELKIRNTRIDLLEEELRLLKDDLDDRNTKNKSLEDAVSRYQLELSQAQEQLLSVEDVKQKTVLQCSATKESLDSTQSQLSDLNDEVTRLNYLLEEEKRKKRLAEERYTQQQEEYEGVLRKRQKELETVSRSKMEIEKSVANKDHEIEQLQRQLEEEAARIKELQKEMSKTTALVKSLQSQYNDIVSERDALLKKLHISEKDKSRMQRLEEDLAHMKLSLDSELRNKQRLQEDHDRVKRDVSYWKDQHDSKQSVMRQYDSDKERLEREKNSLKSEVERLMRELRELEDTYKSRLSTLQKEVKEVTVVRQTMETELKKAREPPTLDPNTLIFDGVRKPVTAKDLLDCDVLDKPTFNQLVKGNKTVPEVSVDKKVNLKGTGPIAGVVIESPKGPRSIKEPLNKMTFTEAKKANLLPPDSVDLLLDAQAATGHIIDPRTNQKLTVEEACNQGVVDDEDKERLLAAEAAAIGYGGPGRSKPLSVFQAMRKGLIDKNTTLRLLQAQESVGGILDPILSVFLPKNTAIERDLINDDIYRALNQRPELYLDPESEEGTTYMAMKRRCKVDPHTGLLLLPVPEKLDPSKLIFEGVRKPVTHKQLLDCGVLDKPTFKDLEKGKKSVPEVSADKIVNLKGTGPIAGVIAGNRGKLSLSEAKKQMLLPADSADLLLEAQAATGHIIDPRTNQKLIVEEACAKGLVDITDRDKLLAAEAAAVGYKDPTSAKPLSVFDAMKKGQIDNNTGLRLLQAQESVGGILDPNLSVFLPHDTAIKRNLLDENTRHALNQCPECYIDPETEQDVTYDNLKKRCKTEPHTGLLLLPVTEKLDPSELIFEGVRKPVTSKQLLDCGVLDKPTFKDLEKGKKSVPEVAIDKKVSLKGTGPIAGVIAGNQDKMSLSEAKKEMLLPSDIADLLLEAQAATGHIIDPKTNKKLTVEEACAKGVVDRSDRDRLLAAEAAAVGYKDPNSAKPLSVFEAMKKGQIDNKTGLRLLQAQESVGGILDPNLSVFLPHDTAIKRNLLDKMTQRALNQNPECYIDPETEQEVSYDALKKTCKKEPHTGLLLL